MLQQILALYKEPPDVAVQDDPDVVRKRFKHWRIRILITLFLAYAVTYSCRKNIGIALPGIADDLGYSFTDLGILGSALYITYGAGKFLNGMMADRANARLFLVTGIVISALLNIVFGLVTTSLFFMVLLWGLNGHFQSMVFPPIAKSLTKWFSRKEMATKWSIFAPSHEVGTAIAIFLSGVALEYLGWRYVFIIPGVFALFFAVIAFINMRDRPRAMGFPTVEEYKGEPVIFQEAEENVKKEKTLTVLKTYIFPNRVLWVLGFANFFIYIIRYGALDWFFLFFTKYKHYGEIEGAGINTFVPLAGIVGAFLAGIISDNFFKNRKMPLNSISFLVLAVLLQILYWIPPGHYLLETLIVGMIGFSIVIPKVLLGGVCVVDSGPTNVAAVATAFVSVFGYIGATIAGPLTGYLLDISNWGSVFTFWTISVLVGLFICLFMIKDENQRLHALD